MLDLFGLGQIGTAITAIIGFVGVAWLALFRAKRQGAADATAKRDAQDAADYIAERERQDAKNVGHGATDADRIRMLERIRDRNRAGKD